MYNITILVLENLVVKGSTYAQQGKVTYALKAITLFDFVFTLHVIKEIMGRNHARCLISFVPQCALLSPLHVYL